MMNYKKLFQLSVAGILAVACTSKFPENRFHLKGTISGKDGQEIYLVYEGVSQEMVVDTAIIDDNTFEFKGPLKKSIMVSTLFMGNIQDWNNPDRCQIYIEPKPMTVTIGSGGFSAPVITGSQTQAEADTLEQLGKRLKEQLTVLRQQMETERDVDKRNAIEEQCRSLKEEMSRLSVNFLKTHPDSFLTPINLRFYMGRMTYEELRAIYDNLTDRVKEGSDMAEIEQELTSLENVQPGKNAPDIKKEDVNGNMVALSDLKGKYVLLDFWASWCVPCRQSFPHVKALYEKYHDKGFEVFCVADNDNQPEEWKKAIEKDEVEMFYHVLRGLRTYTDEKGRHRFDKTHDVSNLYAVHYLPTKYLIDKEGRIVGKFNDDELEVKLAEIFQ